MNTAGAVAAGTAVAGPAGGIAGAAISLVGGVFGKHNSYPNGNPAVLATLDQIGLKARAGNTQALNTLRTISMGGLTPGGDPNGFPTNAGEIINWGDDGKPERATERQYAANIVQQLTGTQQAPPTAAQMPTNPAGTDIWTQLAGQVEGLIRPPAATPTPTGTPGSAPAQATLAPGKWVIIVAVIVALVYLVRRARA